MKANIHPPLKKIKFVCSCKESGDYVCEAYSTISKNIVKVEVCSYCHPFYTGKQRIVDSGGRVEKFMKKKKAAQEAQDKKTERKKKPGISEIKNIPAETPPIKVPSDETSPVEAQPEVKTEKRPAKKRAPRKKKAAE